NSGDWNSGNRNSGNWNSGDWNSGDRNSGDFNLSDNNSGCFNTKQHKLLFFDLPAQVTFEEWRRSDAYYLLSQVDYRPTEWVDEDDMTDVEKVEYPDYETTGGYLKKNDLSKVYAEWWDGLTDRQKQVIREIPNFDAEKFEQITGIKA
ncbi:pentapeptide repeat-containing protein, partial [Sporolactobacillus terrae]|uniref:pentapeptide repeat-containing protein n=1 Tax=Sporolactobacillus terrae TaxID=269673 RepID=UPI000490D121